MNSEELKELELAHRAIQENQDPVDLATVSSFLLTSVVVASYKRPVMLAAAVEQLLGQDYPKLEVIVIDSSPNASDHFATFPFRNDKRVTYIASQVRDLCVNRNVGLLAARGTIAIFVDDDVYVDTDFVFRHVALHQSEEGKKANLIAGNCIPRPNEPSEWIARHVHYRPQGRFAKSMYGVNFSVKRDFALSHGGFNPYIRQVADETEFFMRVVGAPEEAINGREVTLVHRCAREGGTRINSDDSENTAIRMVDRAIFHLSRSKTYLLPYFMLREIAASAKNGETPPFSLLGLRHLLSHFLLFCIRNSLKMRRQQNFMRLSVQAAQPSVQCGKADFSRILQD